LYLPVEFTEHYEGIAVTVGLGADDENLSSAVTFSPALLD